MWWMKLCYDMSFPFALVLVIEANCQRQSVRNHSGTSFYYREQQVERVRDEYGYFCVVWLAFRASIMTNLLVFRYIMINKQPSFIWMPFSLMRNCVEPMLEKWFISNKNINNIRAAFAHQQSEPRPAVLYMCFDIKMIKFSIDRTE